MSPLTFGVEPPTVDLPERNFADDPHYLDFAAAGDAFASSALVLRVSGCFPSNGTCRRDPSPATGRLLCVAHSARRCQGETILLRRECDLVGLRPDARLRPRRARLRAARCGPLPVLHADDRRNGPIVGPIRGPCVAPGDRHRRFSVHVRSVGDARSIRRIYPDLGPSPRAALPLELLISSRSASS